MEDNQPIDRPTLAEGPQHAPMARIWKPGPSGPYPIQRMPGKLPGLNGLAQSSTWFTVMADVHEVMGW
jgi:hypothetical protein